MYKKITKLDYLLFKRMQKIRVKNLNDTCMQLVNYIGEKSVLSDCIALGDKFELDFVKECKKRKLKSDLRKAENIRQAIKVAIDIFEQSN